MIPLGLAPLVRLPESGCSRIGIFIFEQKEHKEIQLIDYDVGAWIARAHTFEYIGYLKRLIVIDA